MALNRFHRSVLVGMCTLLVAISAGADVLRVKYPLGSLHAFLLIRSEDGKLIGTADTVNEPAGSAWRVRLTLHFNDGSVDDDTTIYSQRGTLRLISDHHVQKGPSFSHPMDMTIDAAKKIVTWHDFHDGKDEVKTDAMDLPADLANGLLALVPQNLPRGVDEIKVGYVAASPKPRLIKLAVHADGDDPFTVGGTKRTARKYLVHVEIGGIAGVVAPVVGKQPPDMHIWVVRDGVPTFLRLQAALAEGGPVWNLELASPTWPGVGK